MARDRRYGTMRWRRLARWVVERDRGVCRVVAGCQRPATVADHIVPASLTMADAMFFSPGNLRAACDYHNTARGFAARLEPETSRKPSAVITDDYS